MSLVKKQREAFGLVYSVAAESKAKQALSLCHGSMCM